MIRTPELAMLATHLAGRCCSRRFHQVSVACGRLAMTGRNVSDLWQTLRAPGMSLSMSHALIGTSRPDCGGLLTSSSCCAAWSGGGAGCFHRAWRLQHAVAGAHPVLYCTDGWPTWPAAIARRTSHSFEQSMRRTGWNFTYELRISTARPG